MPQSAISNPPFNIKWTPPLPLDADNRFETLGIPPDSNANYAFVLHILANINNKASIILPNGIMCPNNTIEQSIVKRLVDNGHIEYIISMPERMFESTAISTCVLGISKNPVGQITFVDHRDIYIEEEREQRGQFGGASHTNRLYKKIVNVLTDEMIDGVQSAISQKASILGYCKTVTLQAVAKNEYTLLPSRYVEYKPQETESRSYKEIHRDLCRVLSAKNSVKITINATIAKKILNQCELRCDPSDHVADLLKQNEEKNGTFDQIMSLIGCSPLPKENYLRITKDMLGVIIENKSKGEIVDQIILDFLSFWSVRIRELNIEENTYLAELRDKLCGDLMSGKIELPSEEPPVL